MPLRLEPVRFSYLRLIGTRSPAHVVAHFAAGVDETVAMERGSAVHALVLETIRVIYYRRRRAGKDWEQFAFDNADALILTETEFEKATAMADSVRECRLAVRALEGNREETLEWELAGVRCRGTPDVWTPDRVTDLKTARSSKPDEFERYAINAAYHAQLAWYDEGLRTLGRAQPQEHLIVAVESTPPFPVTVFRLSERALEDGRKKWRLWFEKLKLHMECGLWPPYSQAVEQIDVPEEYDLRFPEDEYGIESNAAEAS